MTNSDFSLRVHKPLWTSEELEIVYKNYARKTIREIKEMLPNRSFSAVKNKIKLIKFGKNTSKSKGENKNDEYGYRSY